MDKYSVATRDEHMKIASLAGSPCPGCGSGRVNYKGLVPHCPNCGTKPWEMNNGAEEKGNRR